MPMDTDWSIEKGLKLLLTNDLFIYLGFKVTFNTLYGSYHDGKFYGQYIQLVKVLYCKLLTNGKQLPAFTLEVRPRFELRSQRLEMRVIPLCHCGPLTNDIGQITKDS